MAGCYMRLPPCIPACGIGRGCHASTSITDPRPVNASRLPVPSGRIVNTCVESSGRTRSGARPETTRHPRRPRLRGEAAASARRSARRRSRSAPRRRRDVWSARRASACCRPARSRAAAPSLVPLANQSDGRSRQRRPSRPPAYVHARRRTRCACRPARHRASRLAAAISRRFALSIPITYTFSSMRSPSGVLGSEIPPRRRTPPASRPD